MRLPPEEFTAPVTPRARKRFQIGNAIVVLEEPPPRLGFRAQAKILGALGPTIAGFLVMEGLALHGTQVTWREMIARDPKSWLAIFNAMMAKLSTVNVDMLCDIVDELVVGRCWIQVRGAEAVEIEHAEQLDMLLPDGLAMAGLARFALELTMGPIFPGGGGNLPPGSPDRSPSDSVAST